MPTVVRARRLLVVSGKLVLLVIHDCTHTFKLHTKRVFGTTGWRQTGRKEKRKKLARRKKGKGTGASHLETETHEPSDAGTLRKALQSAHSNGRVGVSASRSTSYDCSRCHSNTRVTAREHTSPSQANKITSTHRRQQTRCTDAREETAGKGSVSVTRGDVLGEVQQELSSALLDAPTSCRSRPSCPPPLSQFCAPPTATPTGGYAARPKTHNAPAVGPPGRADVSNLLL